MPPFPPPCENRAVVRPVHPPLRRATAALLVGLLTLAPALQATAARAKAVPVLVLPWTALSASEAGAARFSELLRGELRSRGTVKGIGPPARGPGRSHGGGAGNARRPFREGHGTGR